MFTDDADLRPLLFAGLIAAVVIIVTLVQLITGWRIRSPTYG